MPPFSGPEQHLTGVPRLSDRGQVDSLVMHFSVATSENDRYERPWMIVQSAVIIASQKMMNIHTPGLTPEQNVPNHQRRIALLTFNDCFLKNFQNLTPIIIDHKSIPVGVLFTPTVGIRQRSKLN
jgi:hypothetical protein